MRKQRGFIGGAIAEAVGKIFIVTAVVSAIGGWALIEGLIWAFTHIGISIKP